jgi:DNA-binding transcriptional ArsR family regulator
MGITDFTMNDSIYIARWPGLLGALTQGDIDAECTWTEAQVEATLGDANFDAEVYCRFAPLLMDPRCTVTGCKFSDAIQCGATVEEIQRLMEYLGAPDWQMKYVLDKMRSDARSSEHTGRELVCWTQIIRDGLEGVPPEDSDDVFDELVPRLRLDAGQHVARTDLLSVCWLADMAPERHSAHLTELMENGLWSVLQYEGNDIHADYVIETMNECVDAVSQHKSVSRCKALEAFSKSVLISSLDKCGDAALADCGWTSQDAYRVDGMVYDIWATVVNTNWHELEVGVFWENIRDFVWEHCDAYADQFLGDDDERVEIVKERWACRIESDFLHHWYSVDFRLYMPFLRTM